MLTNIQEIKSKTLLFIGVFMFIFLFRYIPHPPNFTPVIALTAYISIFFGIRSSIFVIAAFALSDIFIGLHNLLLFTWGALALVSFAGRFATQLYSRILFLLISSLIFFMVSNFGVWLLSDFYTKDLNGMFACFLLAIPFFTNTLISTLLFGLLFELIILGKSKFVFSNHK